MLPAQASITDTNKRLRHQSKLWVCFQLSELMKLMTRGVWTGLVSFHSPIQKQGCFDWHRAKSYFQDGIMRNVFGALKSESSTASNMHGRGIQALSCSNLFPLINSRRSTGCHPLGWALAPHTTRPRSHDYGSLWGPSSNLSVQESLQTAASIHNLSHSNSFHKEHHSPRRPWFTGEGFLKVVDSIYTQ